MNVWTPVAHAAIHARSWPGDDGAVVYNEMTGATHLLDALGFELLRMIVELPRSSASLHSELAASLAELDTHTAETAIEVALSRLHDAGLIARHPA